MFLLVSQMEKARYLHHVQAWPDQIRLEGIWKLSWNEHLLLFGQVVEKVTVFVMDANDEKPEFQNMPAITDVMEVSRGESCSFMFCGAKT